MFTFCPFYKSGEVVDPWTKILVPLLKVPYTEFIFGSTFRMEKPWTSPVGKTNFSPIFLKEAAGTPHNSAAKRFIWILVPIATPVAHFMLLTLCPFKPQRPQILAVFSPCLGSAWDLYLAYIRNTRTYICENVSDGDGHSYPWSACLFLGLGVPASIALVHLHIDHCR